MLYEAGKTPQLSPLAPYNMGHCHFPLFHGIWDQVTIVCERGGKVLQHDEIVTFQKISPLSARWEVP